MVAMTKVKILSDILLVFPPPSLIQIPVPRADLAPSSPPLPKPPLLSEEYCQNFHLDCEMAHQIEQEWDRRTEDLNRKREERGGLPTVRELKEEEVMEGLGLGDERSQEAARTVWRFGINEG